MKNNWYMKKKKNFIKLNYMTDKYYKVYIDKKYIGQEPTLFLRDLYSVGLAFQFLQDAVVCPSYSYYLNGEIVTNKNKSYKVSANTLTNITFGPFQNKTQTERPTSVLIKICLKCGFVIFKKIYKLPDWNSYTSSSTELNLKLSVTSCIGLRSAAKKLFTKFREINKERNTDVIICTGDVVYLNFNNLTSEDAVQSEYNALKITEEFSGVFVNHVWLCSNDDHEYGFNDGQKGGYNINLLRDTELKNFPLVSPILPTEYRANNTNIKNIQFITLDNVSQRVLNVDSTSDGDRYTSILGESQLSFLLNSLNNARLQAGTIQPVFVISGKTMFGNQSGQTFVYCLKERDIILGHIKKLGLRNVCFLCGDSHYSDVSEYPASNSSNLIIREIRNSALGQTPRTVPDTNPYRVPNSFIGGVNNFGTIDITGTGSTYKISYKVYTETGIVYEYSWNTTY